MTLLLVSGATATVNCYRHDRHLGHLLAPGKSHNKAIWQTGLPVAADNGCFIGLDRTAYIRLLRDVAHRNILWVTAPDIVGDAGATLARFRIWLPVLRYYGVPVAFVAQDGQEHLPVPWDCIRCLFIGGSTAWKEGDAAAALIVQAKRRGKWVHVGRLNTQRRERLLLHLGVDSFDGTTYSRWPDTYIPAVLKRLEVRQEGFHFYE